MESEVHGESPEKNCNDTVKRKEMYYAEKSVGSSHFYKCEACPYMAFAEDDVKCHLFIEHYNLAKQNGLAENVKIQCPGCTSTFETEETLRCHLKTYHKMGLKDIRKMTKSLIQIAITKPNCVGQSVVREKMEEVNEKLPPVIQIQMSESGQKVEPDVEKPVTYITVSEVREMSTVDVAKVNPVELIREASVNILCDTNYPIVNSTSEACVGIVPVPDLIASVSASSSMSFNQVENIYKNGSVEKNDSIENSENPLPMSECNQNKETKKDLKYHCFFQECKIAFESEECLNYHVKCHIDNNLMCPECKVVFNYIATLHNHLWREHKINMELHSCSLCSYKTSSLYRLNNIHIKTHGSAKPYKCEKCPKSYKNQKQLSWHMNLSHKNGVVTCDLCQKEFKKHYLKKHIASFHQNIKLYGCLECGFRSARKWDLKQHVRQHTDNKVYSCDTCGFTATDHNSMRRHKKIHKNGLEYKCKYCSYSTIQSHRLKIHITNLHPDVKDKEIFSCPFCKFTFINRNNYIGHLSKHSDKHDIKALVKSLKEVVEETKVEIIVEVKPDTNSEEKNIPVEEGMDSKGIVKDDEKAIKEKCLIMESSLMQPDVLGLGNDNAGYHFLDKNLDLSQYMLPENCMNSNKSTDMHNFDSYSSYMSLTDSSSNMQTSLEFSSAPEPRYTNNHLSVLNVTLRPLDKITLPSNKSSSPILKTTQIVPGVASGHPQQSNSDPISRKKPKISVKSNLILKGPDEANIFHSQQKMAFKQLEDSEHGNYLDSPDAFENLQFIQLSVSQANMTVESGNERMDNMLTYAPLNDVDSDSSRTTIESESNSISFNRQMNAASFNNMLSQRSTLVSSSNYKIKLETKQNSSPGLERMCTDGNGILHDYCKTSPSLEELNKNMSEIKNEMKSDYFNVPSLRNSNNNSPLIIDPCMLGNVINSNEYLSCNQEMVNTVDVEEDDCEHFEVIDIDDNSEDHKMLPRFDLNFPLDSYYSHASECHYLENDVGMGLINNLLNDCIGDCRISENTCSQVSPDVLLNDNSISGDIPVYPTKEPSLAVNGRPIVNKINVKNIELMKNVDPNDRDFH